jgi:hypothetical protein
MSFAGSPAEGLTVPFDRVARIVDEEDGRCQTVANERAQVLDRLHVGPVPGQ